MSTDFVRLLYQDILDDLAKERTRKAKLEPSQALKRPSVYADPREWTPGRLIALTHTSGQFVGYFREMFHSTSPSTRRLLPAIPPFDDPVEETVSWDWWLLEHNQAPGSPSEARDHAELVARFRELMGAHINGEF